MLIRIQSSAVHPPVSDGEWFSGIITAAIPNEATFDITYDDGDTGEDMEAGCLRRSLEEGLF